MIKSAVSVFLLMACYSSLATAATWAPKVSSAPPPASDVAFVKESASLRFVHRIEVLFSGTVRAVVLAKQPNDSWVEKENKALLSVSADTVKLLAELPRRALPVSRVVVARNPGCDSVPAMLYARNLQSGDLESFYEYTPECGQTDLGIFQRAYDGKTVLSLMNLADGVDVLLRQIVETVKFARLENSILTRDAIVGLRCLAFAAKYESDVDISGLEWNRADDESTHFGAWVGEKLVSTLRLTNILDGSRFEEILLYPSTGVFSEVPCAVLARAATDREYSGRNLGMRLRMMAYEHWIEHSPDERFIYGTALADSARLDALRKWGYEFEKNDQPWPGYLKSGKRDIAVFRMERKKLEQILPNLRREYSTVLP